MHVKALQEENEKLRESIEELEQSVARLQRQIADMKDDEVKAKERLTKCEVRLTGPQAWVWQLWILLFSCVRDFGSGRGICYHNLVGKVEAGQPGSLSGLAPPSPGSWRPGIES